MKPILAAGAALALSSLWLSAAPQEVARAQRPADRNTTTYLAKAGAGDLFEIRSSQIAERRSSNRAVKDFARMLVRDHSRTTQQATAAAREAGLHPRPPALDSAQRAMVRQLERVSARQFDRTYLNQQIPAHEQALTLHRNYARAGRVPGLRRVASGAVPVVTMHLARARELARRH
jgi:putative membrane protein